MGSVSSLIRSPSSILQHRKQYNGLLNKAEAVKAPINICRWTADEELQTLVHTWGTVEKEARDRQTWRALVVTLHARKTEAKFYYSVQWCL